MGAVITKLLWAMIGKLLTEGFFYKFIIRGLWQASQLSSNQLDDKIVEDVAKALGVEDYK